MADASKWWKLFRMLGSDNDGEALAALKKLKETLEREKRSWSWFSDRVEHAMLATEIQRRTDQEFSEQFNNMMRELFGK